GWLWRRTRLPSASSATSTRVFSAPLSTPTPFSTARAACRATGFGARAGAGAGLGAWTADFTVSLAATAAWGADAGCGRSDRSIRAPVAPMQTAAVAMVSRLDRMALGIVRADESPGSSSI
ncbi:MAG: hypothetical protein AVDCRST_MAG89-2090, partial [uncultured Gemmatimonadetes bacterium]